MTTDLAPCRHRLEGDVGECAGSSVCGLLRDLASDLGPVDCSVAAGTCAECARWFPPSEEHPNPVIASLLYNLAIGRLGDPDLGEEERARAEDLRERALRYVPDEEDYAPVRDVVRAQKNLGAVTLGELVPSPARRNGKRVVEWAVGVTTAPRAQSTLGDCLASLADAGWAEPRLFVDGSTEWEAIPEGCPVTHREPGVGAWPSYYLALGELLMRSPEADAYLLVQDDVVLFRHPGLRAYLESILWPGRKPGIVSLFCSRAYAGREPGWQAIRKPLVWGGQALVFPREIAVAFLADARVLRHRFTEKGLFGIDALIGAWAADRHVPVHVSTPSLAEHVGHVSAIWPGARLAGNRRSAGFAGGDP